MKIQNKTERNTRYFIQRSFKTYYIFINKDGEVFRKCQNSEPIKLYLENIYNLIHDIGLEEVSKEEIALML